MIGVSEEEEMLRDPHAQQIRLVLFARPFKSCRPAPMMASMGSPGGNLDKNNLKFKQI
jgi:hypothetical protein